MLPIMNVNYLAVLTCAVLAMPVGFLWFGPLFGNFSEGGRSALQESAPIERIGKRTLC
jgi:hypothetical protein